MLNPRLLVVLSALPDADAALDAVLTALSAAKRPYGLRFALPARFQDALENALQATGALGVGDLLGRLPRSSVRPPTEAQLMPDRLRLVVSDMGRPAISEHVTWTGLRPPQGGAFVDPDGPDAVTLLVSDLQGGRTFTAAYSSAMVSPAVMRDVVDSICANPVALLEDSRV